MCLTICFWPSFLLNTKNGLFRHPHHGQMSKCVAKLGQKIPFWASWETKICIGHGHLPVTIISLKQRCTGELLENLYRWWTWRLKVYKKIEWLKITQTILTLRSLRLDLTINNVDLIGSSWDMPWAEYDVGCLTMAHTSHFHGGSLDWIKCLRSQQIQFRGCDAIPIVSWSNANLMLADS